MVPTMRARANVQPLDYRSAKAKANEYRHTFRVGYVDLDGVPVRVEDRTRINRGIARLEAWAERYRRRPLPPGRL